MVSLDGQVSDSVTINLMVPKFWKRPLELVVNADSRLLNKIRTLSFMAALIEARDSGSLSTSFTTDCKRPRLSASYVLFMAIMILCYSSFYVIVASMLLYNIEAGSLRASLPSVYSK